MLSLLWDQRPALPLTYPRVPPSLPQFAFVTYARLEAATAALQSVNGTLCPQLNTASLIRVEYRRGPGMRAGGSRPGNDPRSSAAGSGSSAGSELSCRSESVRSEGGASVERGSSASLACHGRSSFPFLGDSCIPGEGAAYRYPPAYAVAFAYPCYLAPM